MKQIKLNNTNEDLWLSTYILGSLNWSKLISLNTASLTVTEKKEFDTAVSILGFNPSDGYLYAEYIIQPSPNLLFEFVRIDINNFNIEHLGLPVGFPADNWGMSRTFDKQGYLYRYTDDIYDAIYYTIDLRKDSPYYMQLVDPTNGYIPQLSAPYGTPIVGDFPAMLLLNWTAHPDGLLYGVTYNGTMATLNPTVGHLTLIPTTGDLMSDGTLLLATSHSGIIYAVFDNISPASQIKPLLKYEIINNTALCTNIGSFDINAPETIIGIGITPYVEPSDTISNTAELDLTTCDEETVTLESNEINVEILDLSITKSVSCPWTVPGARLSYTVTISNQSSTNLTDLVFRDVLDSHVSYIVNTFMVNGVPATPTVVGQTLEYNIATLNAGQVMTISYSVLVH